MRRTVAVAFIVLSILLLVWSVFAFVDFASRAVVLVTAREWWEIGARVLFAGTLAVLSIVALRAGRLRW